MNVIAPASFLKIAIVLLFGGTTDAPPAPQRIDPLPVFLEAAPLHAKVDLMEARKLLAGSPQLKEAIVGEENGNIDVVRRQAAATLAQELKVSADDLLVAFNQINIIHFSILGFGEEPEDIRVAAILQCGQAHNLLENTFGTSTGEGRPLSLTHYGTVPIYQLGQGDEGTFWIAQQGGSIIVASDPILVQRFISGSFERELIHSSLAPPVPALLEVTIDPQMILTDWIEVIEYDRDELFFMSSLLDIGSWEEIKAVYDGKRLIADLSFGNDWRYAGKLDGKAAPQSLLGIVPESAFFSVVLALDQPESFGKEVLAAIQQGLIWAGGEDELQEFLEEFRDELGMDLETEFLRDMAEVALVFARPDDEPTAVLYKARNGQAARQMIQKLKSAHAAEGYAMQMQGDWETWDIDGVLIALSESTIVIGEKGDAQLLTLLRRQAGDTGTALPAFPENLSKSTVTLSFAPGKALGMPGLQPIRMGLNAEENRLRLEADIDIVALGRPFIGVTQEVRTKTNRVRCMNNLRQLFMACLMYRADYARMPTNFDALKDYISSPDTMVCPESGKPYVYNTAIAGMDLGNIENPAAMVLAHDTPGAHEKGGNVLFVDGHIEWLNTRQFQQKIEGK